MIEESHPPIRACLFDMDGLLIDSEEIYTIVTNRILAEYGKSPIPWSIKSQLQGRPGPEAYKIFEKWAQLPLTAAEFSVKQRKLQEEGFPSTKPLPGVVELIETLKSSPSKPFIALATSSNSHMYQLKTSHLVPDLFSMFEDELIVKGDDPRIPTGKGKPAPDIYLLALDLCNEKRKREMLEKGVQEAEITATRITPRECLVFEDSVPGAEAGRRAGMRVVWVPHEGLRGEYSGREEEVLAGLTGQGEHDVEKEGIITRKIGDGWGEARGTLVGFDYSRYGIETMENQSKV